ncbi:MAG: ArsA family ATPase [Acidimicrobiales bacterium]
MRTAGLELLVVVGKGGVGRSTIAAALASQAATTNDGTERRVLLVDATADGGTARALGLARSPKKGVATKLDVPPGQPGHGVTLLELGTEASLDEYVRLNFKVPIAPRSLGPIARIFDYVATAAPAVREILTIGKIGHEVTNGGWDLVVVDAPATGHVVELLGSPGALGELVGSGPLAADTDWLIALLADPAKTAAIAVTQAEELPRSETIELLDRLADETDVAIAGLVVNRVPPLLTDLGEREAEERIANGSAKSMELVALALNRHRIATAELAALGDLGLPMITVGERLDDPLAAALAALEASAELQPETRQG